MAGVLLCRRIYGIPLAGRRGLKRDRVNNRRRRRGRRCRKQTARVAKLSGYDGDGDENEDYAVIKAAVVTIE